MPARSAATSSIRRAIARRCSGSPAGRAGCRPSIPSTSISRTPSSWPRSTGSGTSCATCPSAAACRRSRPRSRSLASAKERLMSVRISRRAFLLGSTAVAATLPFPAIGQNKPVRIGLLTVKTGPLAQGGNQMEQGVTRFLKDRSYTLAGRKAELVVADTGGNPAGTKTKTQELIERDNVDLIFGPLAAFELLAITDYAAQARMPILSLAAAEDMTQRKPNPYFVLASATSAQTMQPLADYAAKELKLKRVITVSEDFAYGHEQMGGFQRVFEDAGGRV